MDSLRKKQQSGVSGTRIPPSLPNTFSSSQSFTQPRFSQQPVIAKSLSRDSILQSVQQQRINSKNTVPQAEVPPLPKIQALPLPTRTPRIARLNKTTIDKQHKKSPWRIAALRFVQFFMLCILALCIFFGWKVYAVSNIIHVSDTASSQNNTSPTSPLQNIQSVATSLIHDDIQNLKSDTQGRINILLLGRAGEHHSGKNLTDTIMMMSIDTKSKKIALLSLSRDLYVQIPHTKMSTKVNAVYQHGLQENKGLELIQETVETITGQPIHYALIIDFDGFEKVIDAIGGIHIEVMRDIYDARYPGPNYSYETFEIKKGWHTLDGATALKYVRERHDDPEGDFGRAKRQQQVIQAVKNTVFSLNTFTNVFALNKLLDILGDSIKTTISTNEIGSFITLSKQTDTQNINNVVIDAWKPESLLRVSHVMVGSTNMFTLLPRVGNYSEIQDVASNIFSSDVLQKRRDAIREENPSITLINTSSNPKLTLKLRKILRENLGFEHAFIEIGDSSTLPKRAKESNLNSTNNIQGDSFIIDNIQKKKPFSLDELMKKLSVKLSDSTHFQDYLDPYESDFTIIIGNSLAQELDFEEVTPEDFKKYTEDEVDEN